MRAGRLARAAAVALIPVLLVGLGLSARAVAGAAFRDFVRYETPFPMPPAGVSTGEPLARTVVLVLLDGLGLPASRGLPYLDELRARGADYDCRVGEPSLSLPGRAVLLSGAWPEVNGQLSNDNPRPLRVDHVFAAARRKGGLTALAAGRRPGLLFGGGLVRHVVYARGPEEASWVAYEAASERQLSQGLSLIEEVRGRPGLVMVDLSAVDQAGHAWGARSEEYTRAARKVDDAVRRLAGGHDFARDTLVVVADHGHVAAGGHGGPEAEVVHVPLVMAGAGIRPGVRGSSRHVDVAPTLSTLLGLEVPGSNQGRPLLDALDLDAARRREALKAVVAQRARFVENYVYRLATLDDPAARGRLLEPPPVDAPAGADERWWAARLDALDRRESDGRLARTMLEAESRSRPVLVFVFAPLVVAALLVALRVVSTRELVGAMVAAAAGVALYHVALPALGLAYSFTAVNKDEQLAAFFRKDMALGLAACTVAVFAAAWRERRASGAGLFDLARVAWLVTGVFCYAFLVKLAWVFWEQGASVTWRLGDMSRGFGFYLDALVVMAVGLLAPLMFLPAWPAALRRPPAAGAAAAAAAPAPLSPKRG